MSELSIALIGAGFMGKAHSVAYAMAPAAFQLPVRLRLRVVVDVTDELATAAARNFGLEEAATSWEEVVQRDD
jgi:predicted dehydrogenase